MQHRAAAVLASALVVAPATAVADELPPPEEEALPDGAEDPDGAEVHAADDEPRLFTAEDRADTGDDAPEPTGSLDHHRQVGVSLQIPVGVRAIVPYDGEYCGARGENENANAEVCIGRTPATLDFVVSYGVRPNLEVLLELRVGVERDFGATAAMADAGPRLFHWAPGVKFYYAEGGSSKLFTSAQIAFDHTGYANEAGTDVFLRNVNGLQWDLHPSYGLYVYVGEELAFRRWFWIGVEAGLGIQGRYP